MGASEAQLTLGWGRYNCTGGEEVTGASTVGRRRFASTQKVNSHWPGGVTDINELTPVDY